MRVVINLMDLVRSKAFIHLFLILQGTMEGLLKAKTSLESDSSHKRTQFLEASISIAIITSVSSARKAFPSPIFKAKLPKHYYKMWNRQRTLDNAYLQKRY
ncbi:hypothetical protein QL285_051785 [Trifolium repens]|nr:hypothetical protein QL285_051785 [Trifolium repens]